MRVFCYCLQYLRRRGSRISRHKVQTRRKCTEGYGSVTHNIFFSHNNTTFQVIYKFSYISILYPPRLSMTTNILGQHHFTVIKWCCPFKFMLFFLTCICDTMFLEFCVIRIYYVCKTICQSCSKGITDSMYLP